MDRERLYRTEAIILKRSDWGEADRLLTVYTIDRGKLRWLAKGARKLTSRKAGHIELFTHSRFLIARGRNLDIVTQAETVDAFRPLREDLFRTSYAYYVAELVDRFTEEADAQPGVFRLLRETLTRLCEPGDLRLAVRYHELALLTLAGYQPQLFLCTLCTTPVQPEINSFSPVSGGVVCPGCAEQETSHGARPLSLNALKVLRFLQTREWPLCQNLRLSEAVHQEVEAVLQRYIFYVLERRLKSVEFLRTVRRQIASEELEKSR